MSEKILDIKEERLSFFTPAGEVKALNGVSFAMNQGDVLGIVGESGSGKSVTAYSVMGLTAYPGKLVGGTVWFNGHEIEKMKEKDFRKIRGNEVSIIFQDPMTSLNPVYTIGNQIVEVIRLHTKKSKQEAWARAEELLELVGINEPEKRLKQYPHELSGGMRQRVMIAIALACEPKLLIADEPTTALDVTIQAQILELMQELRKKLGMSIIMITHDLGVVASMCEKIAVMYAGHIVEYGTTDEIFYQPGHEYTKGQAERRGEGAPGAHRGPACGPAESAGRLPLCTPLQELHEDLSEQDASAHRAQRHPLYLLLAAAEGCI